MDEILPGLYHWSAIHPRIRIRVHSYLVTGPAGDGGTAIDPLLPEGGVEALRAVRAPVQVLLTNRHHWRDSGALVEAFGCTVRCHEAGLHEFGPDRPVTGFRWGDRLAAGIEAVELDAICDEETVLHVDVAEGALAFADGLMRGRDGELTYVSDPLLGDDPAAVRAALTERLAGLIDRDFDHLLLAHGAPIVGGGHAALRAFVERQRP